MGTHGGQIRSISGTLIGRRLLGTLGGVEGRNKPLNNPKNSLQLPPSYKGENRWLFSCLFHETQWLLEVLEIIGTDGSLILIFFFKYSKPTVLRFWSEDSTIVREIKYPSNTGLKVEQVVWIAGVCYIVHQTTVEATSWKSFNNKHRVLILIADST